MRRTCRVLQIFSFFFIVAGGGSVGYLLLRRVFQPYELVITLMLACVLSLTFFGYIDELIYRRFDGCNWAYCLFAGLVYVISVVILYVCKKIM